MNWLEKYRPRTLDDVFGQSYIKEKLLILVNNVQIGKVEIPHMFFAGEPGLGKTAMAQSFSRDILGRGFQMNYLELNASDERGIDVVRGNIKTFAKGRPLGSPFRILYLSEVDNLTQDAQMALRRTMERWANQCVFIMSCNRPEKVIPALKDRCMFGTRRFARLKTNEIAGLCDKISEGEGFKLEPGAAMYLGKVVYRRYGGSARKAIMILQECSLKKVTDTPITKENFKEALNIHKHLFTDEFLKTLFSDGSEDRVATYVDVLYYDKGVNCITLIRDLFDAVMGSRKVNTVIKKNFAAEVGRTIYEISNCDDELLYFKSWLRYVPSKVMKRG